MYGVDKDRKTLRDRLMIRVGKAIYDDLLQKTGCREMDFTGKMMKGFLFVYQEGCYDNEKDLDFGFIKHFVQQELYEAKIMHMPND